MASTALLMGCTSAEDKAYKNAALSHRIFVATVDLASEEINAATLMEEAYDYELLITEGHKNPSRCCRYTKNDYRIDDLGLPRTGEDILAVIGSNASLYTITLPDPSDTALIEPLFGKRMRRHVMKEPQRGCYVVSGVRDGVLRAGVIAHEVPIQYTGFKHDELNYIAINICLTSAVLLLHGFTESEAMDASVYTKDIGWRSVRIAPDFKKIADREAEILAQREK